MSNKIDRTGEEGCNNFGSKMVITKYKNARNIDVYFPEYNWTAKNKSYDYFKKGKVKCPYEPTVHNHGYIGEGEYKMSENKKATKCYEVWNKMLQRCYDKKIHKNRPTYTKGEVCNEWLCYQNFAKWFYNNYYEVENEKMCLDKDVLHKGNKIYSPENCVFVPERINTLFIKCDKARGKYPVGTYYDKASKKFRAQCSIYNYETNKSKQFQLGSYDSVKKAFEVYKQFKENHIKHMAERYKEQIPKKLYDAMYDYKVEIDD